MVPVEDEDGGAVENEIEDDDTDADEHGNEAAVDGVKGGLEHFDGGIEDQTEGVGLK